MHIQRADRAFGVDVNCKNIIDLIHDTVFYELHGSAGEEFFCLLKNEIDGSRNEFGVFCQDFRSRHQDCCVRIVAAGVHYAGDSAFIRQIVVFDQPECIDIGAQSDGRTGFVSF